MVETNNGISEYLKQKASHRVEKKTMMKQGSEEEREISRRLDMGATVLRISMRNQEISKLDLAKELRVGEDFVTFLIGGLVFPEEITTSMRRKMAKKFGIDLEAINLFFGSAGGKK